MFADVALDDSYTPQRISLRAGTYFGDLVEIKNIDLSAPAGWQHFVLGGPGVPGEDSSVEPDILGS